jgi:hypothetical protein
MINLIDADTYYEHKKYVITFDSWREINGEPIHILNRNFRKDSLLRLYMPNSGVHLPPYALRQLDGSLPLFRDNVKGDRYIQLSRIDAITAEEEFYLELSGYHMKVEV